MIYFCIWAQFSVTYKPPKWMLNKWVSNWSFTWFKNWYDRQYSWCLLFLIFCSFQSVGKFRVLASGYFSPNPKLYSNLALYHEYNFGHILLTSMNDWIYCFTHDSQRSKDFEGYTCYNSLPTTAVAGSRVPNQWYSVTQQVITYEEHKLSACSVPRDDINGTNNWLVGCIGINSCCIFSW